MSCTGDAEILNSVVATSSCLNQDGSHVVSNILKKNDMILKSDTDHQLIIVLEFQQPVKLSALKFFGVSEGTAPSEIRLFINKPDLGFSDAEDAMSTQDLLLTAADNNLTSGSGERCVNLKYVKFQSVNSLTIFVNENLGGEEVTEIKYLEVHGAKGESANIADWKPCKS